MNIIKESSLDIFLDSEMLGEYISIMDQSDYDDVFIPKLSQFYNSGYEKESFEDEIDTFPWAIFDRSLEEDVKGLVRLIGPSMLDVQWPALKGALDSFRLGGDMPSSPTPSHRDNEDNRNEVRQKDVGTTIPIFPESDAPVAEEGADTSEEALDDSAANAPSISMSPEEVRAKIASLGLERKSGGYRKDNLPRIFVNEADSFRNYLMSLGIHVSEVNSESASSFNGLLGEGEFSYGSISRRLREDDLNRIKSQRLIVSSDMDIVDGNHGWAIVYLASLELEGFSSGMNAYVVDLSTKDLIDIAEEWSSRADVKRARRLSHLKDQVSIEPNSADPYDRFKFLPEEVRAGIEGGDFYYNFRTNKPENPSRFGEFLSEFPFGLGDSRFEALTREINGLQNLFLDELRLITMIEEELSLSGEGNMPLTLSNKEADLKRIRGDIKESIDILEALKRPISNEHSFPNASTIDAVNDIDDEIDLDPIDIPSFKISHKKSMIVNQDRFRAKKRAMESQGKSFSIGEYYFYSILDDPSLLNYIVEQEVDGEIVPVPDVNTFKKFLLACESSIASEAGSQESANDKIRVFNNFIAALKILEDEKIEYLSKFDIGSPDSWIRNKGVSIREEILASSSLKDLSEDEAVTTAHMLSGRSRLFAMLFLQLGLISKMGNFYNQPIDREQGGERIGYEDKIPWREKYFRNVPDDLNTITDLPVRFRTYVYELHASKLESIFNRDDRALWNGGEYESDIHSFQLSAGIPKLKSQFLGTFVRNKTPGHDLVKCPVCYKEKEVEYRLSGFTNYKDKVPEYRSKVVTDLYSPLTEGGEIITREMLAGTRENPLSWDIDGNSYTWNDIIKMTHDSNEAVVVDGFLKKSEVYKRLNSKLIKSDVPIDSIRFKCPMNDCGIDYTYSDDFESFEEINLSNLQPGRVRVVSDQVIHDLEVVSDFYDWLEYPSFVDFIDKNAKLLGVDQGRMISIIEDLNNIEIPIDPDTGKKMPEWFSDNREFVIKHESIKEVAMKYIGDSGLSGQIIREIKDNNLLFRRIPNNKWNEEVVSNNFSKEVIDAINISDGKITVRQREYTENKLHDSGGSDFSEIRDMARRPGYKFSKMLFPCPCHIDNPGVDAINKYNTLAFPHSGPVGFNQDADIYRGRPTGPDGSYFDLEFGTLGFLVCGTPTSLSAFTRNPSNENNIRRFIESGKTRAVEFLIENGVDVEDIRVFMEGFIKNSSVYERRRIATVERLFKAAMAKVIKQDLIEELGHLSLTCPHGHAFTIKQSWDFGSTHFGCNLNTHTSARGDSRPSGDGVKTGKSLENGSKYNRYLPIIRTKGFENLLNVMNSGSGIGKYKSYMFRRIKDDDLNDEKYIRWMESRDNGDLIELMNGSGDAARGIGKTKFKDHTVINIPQASDLENFIMSIESEAYRERVIEMLSELNGSYYLHSKTIMQSSIIDYGKAYNVASAIRGKHFIRELIEQNTMVSENKYRDDGDGVSGDAHERTDAAAFSEVLRSGSSSESFYSSASEIPLGSPSLYRHIKETTLDDPQHISWLLLYKKIKLEVSKMDHLNEEQRDAEISSYLRSYGYNSDNVRSDRSEGMEQAALMSQMGTSNIMEKLDEKIGGELEELISSQYDDFTSGLKSYIKIINTYYLDSIQQSTYRYMKSIAGGDLSYKPIPQPEEFGEDIRLLINSLLEDGVIVYSDYIQDGESDSVLSEFSSYVSESLYMSLTGPGKEINLNNIVFDSSDEKEISIKETDTLGDIAKKYNVTVQNISEWNKLGRSFENIDKMISFGKIKSLIIRGKNKSSISDMISFSIAKSIEGVASTEEHGIELATKEGSITDSLVNYIYSVIEESGDDPEFIAEDFFYSLTDAGLRDAPRSVRPQVGKYDDSAGDMGTGLFSNIASEFDFIRESEEGSISEDMYYSAIRKSLDSLVQAGSLSLRSTDTVSSSGIISAVKSKIPSSGIISNNFYPDQISFGSYYRDESTHDETKMIASQLTLLAYVLYLADGLIFVNNNYLREDSPKYIGINLGLSDSLSSIDSILSVGNYSLDSIIRSYRDIPGDIQMGIKESFRRHIDSSVTSLDSYIWGYMPEAFSVLNNRMLGGSQCTSYKYISMAREIMRERLEEHSDYFDDPMRSIAFERASIVKSIPLSIESEGFYAPNRSPKVIYNHKSTGSNAGVVSSIDDLDDTDNSLGYPINESIGYDGRHICVGRIGKPGSFDYKYPPSNKVMDSYKGSVGFTLPFLFGWSEPKRARTRLNKLGNITIPDFKVVVRIDGDGGQPANLYDITFLFKKSDESDSITERLKEDLKKANKIEKDIEQSEIMLGMESDEEIKGSLMSKISDLKSKYETLSYAMESIKTELERHPPKIFTKITNRSLAKGERPDGLGGAEQNNISPGESESLYSVPALCLIDPYTAYEYIMNPEISGSTHRSEQEKRALVRFVYDIYNFEPIARELASRGEVYASNNQDGSLDIDIENISRILDSRYYSRYKKGISKATEESAKSGHGKYYQIEAVDPGDNSELSYIRYMPLQLSRAKLKKSLDLFRSNLGLSSSNYESNDSNALVKIQKIIKSMDKGARISRALWGDDELPILNRALVVGWPKDLSSESLALQFLNSKGVTIISQGSMSDSGFASAIKGKCSSVFTASDYASLLEKIAIDNGIIINEDVSLEPTDTFMDLDSYAGYTGVLNEFIGRMIGESNSYFYNSASNRRSSDAEMKKEAAVSSLEKLFKISKLKYARGGTIIPMPTL